MRSRPRLSNRSLMMVEWVDSCTSSEWQDVGEAVKVPPLLCRTVGWVVRNDRTQVNLVQSLNGQGAVGATWVIPKSCVRKMRRLR